MTITLAFDVYGTLIDTHGVLVSLEKHLDEKSKQFSQLWRDKQLEYSFRRGLMQNYQNFAVCTRDALEYCCLAFKTPLSAKVKQELMDAYRVLPAFEDVEPGLKQVKAAGFQLFAFSNGSKEAVETLLSTAGITGYFADVVSTDEIKSFKPNPAVYCHFLRRSGAVGADAWMISSNPFDVIGAISSGMRAAWVQRSNNSIFDPWEIKPTISINNLLELANSINKSNSGLS